MGTILASTIIDTVEGILQDTDNDRWSAADHLGYLNSIQRLIVYLKPNAYVVNEAVVCVAGTKQSIPSDGVQLINIVRNMGTDGTTPGRAVVKGDLDQFNVIERDWHSAEASATAELFFFDEQDPKNFYVYPPQPTSSFGYLEQVYSKSPADVASDEAITLDDTYEDVIKNGMLYLAYARETDPDSQNQSRSYFDLFATQLGRRDLIEAQYKPRKRGDTDGV